MQQNSGAEKWPDLAGRVEGKKHILPVRVYFEDTDFTGLVYHANYLKFCERARSDFIRLLGVHQSDLFKTGGIQDAPGGAAFVVRHLEIDYLKPARIDDILEIVTSIGEIGKATLTLNQEVRKNEQLLTRVSVMVVLINNKGKPLRIAQTLKDLLENTEPHS